MHHLWRGVFNYNFYTDDVKLLFQVCEWRLNFFYDQRKQSNKVKE